MNQPSDADRYPAERVRSRTARRGRNWSGIPGAAAGVAQGTARARGGCEDTCRIRSCAFLRGLDA